MKTDRKAYHRQQFHAPRFTQGEIIRATECPKVTLSNLTNRLNRELSLDFVEPDRERGRIRRLYSKRDAILLGVVAAMDRLGVAPSDAAVHAKAITDWLEDDKRILFEDTNFKMGCPALFLVDSVSGEGKVVDSFDAIGLVAVAHIVIDIAALANKITTRLAEPYQLKPIKSESDWQVAREKASSRDAEE